MICTHYYKLEPVTGPYSWGVCAYCGDRRLYGNTMAAIAESKSFGHNSYPDSDPVKAAKAPCSAP